MLSSWKGHLVLVIIIFTSMLVKWVGKIVNQNWTRGVLLRLLVLECLPSFHSLESRVRCQNKVPYKKIKNLPAASLELTFPKKSAEVVQQRWRFKQKILGSNPCNKTTKEGSVRLRIRRNLGSNLWQLGLSLFSFSFIFLSVFLPSFSPSFFRLLLHF